MSKKIRARWVFAAAVPLLLTVTACGAASDPNAGGGNDDKLVVWDWHSGNPDAKPYFDAAKAQFKQDHPGIEVEFVAQPFDQYYTLLGTAIEAGDGPDIAMFNGGAQMRDRMDALVPLDEEIGDDLRSRLTGWPAFQDGNSTYGVPLTVQGFPFYYNKAVYEKAGLDPEAAPTNFAELKVVCDAIKASGNACFDVGNKEGLSIEFFLSGFGPGALTPEEYDDWLAGTRDWKSPEVKAIFDLWTNANNDGWFNKGVNSTAQFNDQYTMFSGGKGGNTIGLISDTAHWGDFDEFLGDDLGVYVGPILNDQVAESALAAEGGIGYSVMNWTSDKDLAFSLIEDLADTAALQKFGEGTGAITSDTTVDTSSIQVEAGKEIVDLLPTAKPLLHTALTADQLDLLHRLSQKLISGDVTVDEALDQLAATEK